MVIRRSEIWWASLPEPVGAEPGYRRPILIVQSDDFNRSRISTVVAVIITSNIRLAQAPGNIFLSRNLTGLPKDSVANISQIVTVDKNFITEQVGVLSSDIMEKVEEGLRLVLRL
ncbi:type II toxin-antitoxin system PemK/MazF family toxin [Desulfobacterales bacterium HSG2]|nr:type II toxin-antitoxin system PemK/MazF family toxin [Desulfobacterales bacterium HSG2]